MINRRSSLGLSIRGRGRPAILARNRRRAGEAGTARYPERWVYCSANLQVDQSVKDVIALIQRAKKRRLHGDADRRLQAPGPRPRPGLLLPNVEKVKAAAAKAGIELVPAVFSIGYSNGHLSHDPNLAEGLPVVDQPYRRPTAERTVAGASPRRACRPRVTWKPSSTRDFPSTSQRQPRAGPGRSVRRASRSRMIPASRPSPTARSSTAGASPAGSSPAPRDRSASRPTSGWCSTSRSGRTPPTGSRAGSKTQDLGPSGAFQLLALGTSQPGRQLTFHEGGLEPNQDWKRIEVVFNSLDQTEANLYVGIWGAGHGHALGRRPRSSRSCRWSTSCGATGARSPSSRPTARRLYEEGRDFEPVRRPQARRRFPGRANTSSTTPGATIRLTPGSRIKNGDRLA